jgi:hypothetical protein
VVCVWFLDWGIPSASPECLALIPKLPKLKKIPFPGSVAFDVAVEGHPRAAVFHRQTWEVASVHGRDVR